MSFDFQHQDLDFRLFDEPILLPERMLKKLVVLLGFQIEDNWWEWNDPTYHYLARVIFSSSFLNTFPSQKKISHLLLGERF